MTKHVYKMRNDWTQLSDTQRITARGLMLLTGTIALAGLVGWVSRPVDAERELYLGSVSLNSVILPTLPEIDLSDLKIPPKEIAAAALEAARSEALVGYAIRYDISNELAALIWDVATEERIDPELAFRIVYVESAFNPQAISSAGALGLAQVMPETAEFFAPGFAREDLFDAENNLRIGFKHLRWFVDRYEGDLPMALLAYNRGPNRLQQLLARGIDPANGYASRILRGYEPSPVYPLN